MQAHLAACSPRLRDQPVLDQFGTPLPSLIPCERVPNGPRVCTGAAATPLLQLKSAPGAHGSTAAVSVGFSARPLSSRGPEEQVQCVTRVRFSHPAPLSLSHRRSSSVCLSPVVMTTSKYDCFRDDPSATDVGRSVNDGRGPSSGTDCRRNPARRAEPGEPAPLFSEERCRLVHRDPGRASPRTEFTRDCSTFLQALGGCH